MLVCGVVQAQLTPTQYREDFEYFWRTIKEDYCYWDKKQTDWEKAKTIYAPMIDTVRSKHSFVMLMERMFHEIYDHHASLSTNTKQSSKLVPSGTDLWAVFIGNKPLITEVRKGSGAEKAGIRAGMEVISVNNVPIEEKMHPFNARSLKQADGEARDYALRVALAGTHDTKRQLRLRWNGAEKDYSPDDFPQVTYQGDIETKEKWKVGYLRINNSLGDNDLIPLFDSALNALRHTKAMILDLRETPSGGNTTVARAIIGRFITQAGYYQQHELTAEQRQYGIKRSWSEIVSPRAPVYSKPLVILVNHWTGSVAEGITIGFDALKRARIIGPGMAGLNGAIYSYTMPNSGIGFSFPVEKLLHMNGTPRENFKPSTIVAPVAGKDAVLEKAFELLTTKGERIR
ncbi:MAG: peptidase [Chitinophagaceae bacterium]|jgi:carboxyl-terminal processing protease|nr:peptidase [Chitinophagaceae bacterium]